MFCPGARRIGRHDGVSFGATLKGGLRGVRYQDDLDAPVPRTPGIGIVAGNRAGVAITLDREARDRNARCVHQPVAHGPGARDRQLQIAAGVADVIRVSGDQNPLVRMSPD